MSKGLKKFFIVCAAAVAVGLVLTVVGIVTGGIHSMNELNGKYSWFRAGYAQMEYAHLEDGAEFDSIDVKGSADIVLCRGESDKSRIAYDKNSKTPVFEVKDGVLTVDFTGVDSSAVINFSMGDYTPEVEVYIPEGKALKNINGDIGYGDITIENISADNITCITGSGDIDLKNVSADAVSMESQYGDVYMRDVTYDSMDIETDSGDIDGEGIKSKGLRIQSQMGDIELGGEFKGITDITSECGDVDVITSLEEAMYTVDADVRMGDLDIGHSEYENMSQHITQGTGKNLIKIMSQMGDVSITFAL